MKVVIGNNHKTDTKKTHYDGLKTSSINLITLKNKVVVYMLLGVICSGDFLDVFYGFQE